MLLPLRAGPSPGCFSRRLVFIHSALGPSGLDGVDGWALLLAGQAAALACGRPLFVSAGSAPEDETVRATTLDQLGCDFLADGADLAVLRSWLEPAPAGGGAPPYDAAFITFRPPPAADPGAPLTLPEAVMAWPAPARARLGRLVALAAGVGPAGVETGGGGGAHEAEAADTGLLEAVVEASVALPDPAQALDQHTRSSASTGGGGTACSDPPQAGSACGREMAVYRAMDAALLPSAVDMRVLRGWVGGEEGARTQRLCRLPFALPARGRGRGAAAPSGALCMLGEGSPEDVLGLRWFLEGAASLAASNVTIRLDGEGWRARGAAAAAACAARGLRCGLSAVGDTNGGCWAVLAPVLAARSGTHVQLVHWLSSGVPVFTTAVGALDFDPGAASCAGVHAAGSAAEMAGAMLRMLGDPAAHAQAAGRAAAYPHGCATQALPGCVLQLLESG